MASVKLHHPSFTNVNYVVELAWLPNASTDACNACSQPERPMHHQYKSLHLRLDGAGDVFVAEGILELLRKVPDMAGLQIVEGRNAPPQFVGAIELSTQDIVNANERFYVPGRTKYEARDKMQEPYQPIVNQILENIDRQVTAKKAEKSTTFIFGKRRD